MRQGYGMAGAGATAVEGLEGAVLALACFDLNDRPEMQVLVNYWLPGSLRTEDVYTLDLFNSTISGRPASYDLGRGEVSTAALSFHVNEVPPPGYYAAVASFSRALNALPGDATIRVRFTPRRYASETVTATFPAQGLAEALTGIAGSETCPPDSLKR